MIRERSVRVGAKPVVTWFGAELARKKEFQFCSVNLGAVLVQKKCNIRGNTAEYSELFETRTKESSW